MKNLFKCSLLQNIFTESELDLNLDSTLDLKDYSFLKVDIGGYYTFDKRVTPKFTQSLVNQFKDLGLNVLYLNISKEFPITYEEWCDIFELFNNSEIKLGVYASETLNWSEELISNIANLKAFYNWIMESDSLSTTLLYNKDYSNLNLKICVPLVSQNNYENVGYVVKKGRETKLSVIKMIPYLKDIDIQLINARLENYLTKDILEILDVCRLYNIKLILHAWDILKLKGQGLFSKNEIYKDFSVINNHPAFAGIYIYDEPPMVGKGENYIVDNNNYLSYHQLKNTFKKPIYLTLHSPLTSSLYTRENFNEYNLNIYELYFEEYMPYTDCISSSVYPITINTFRKSSYGDIYYTIVNNKKVELYDLWMIVPIDYYDRLLCELTWYNKPQVYYEFLSFLLEKHKKYPKKPFKLFINITREGSHPSLSKEGLSLQTYMILMFGVNSIQYFTLHDIPTIVQPLNEYFWTNIEGTTRYDGDDVICDIKNIYGETVCGVVGLPVTRDASGYYIDAEGNSYPYKYTTTWFNGLKLLVHGFTEYKYAKWTYNGKYYSDDEVTTYGDQHALTIAKSDLSNHRSYLNSPFNSNGEINAKYYNILKDFNNSLRYKKYKLLLQSMVIDEVKWYNGLCVTDNNKALERCFLTSDDVVNQTFFHYTTFNEPENIFIEKITDEVYVSYGHKGNEEYCSILNLSLKYNVPITLKEGNYIVDVEETLITKNNKNYILTPGNLIIIKKVNPSEEIVRNIISSETSLELIYDNTHKLLVLTKVDAYKSLMLGSNGLMILNLNLKEFITSSKFIHFKNLLSNLVKESILLDNDRIFSIKASNKVNSYNIILNVSKIPVSINLESGSKIMNLEDFTSTKILEDTQYKIQPEDVICIKLGEQ